MRGTRLVTAILVLSAVPLRGADTPRAADSSIRIDASAVTNQITPYMTGSCIEDVNHEIYGGLYAQLIFGESFEEPPAPASPVKGWTAYGGGWRLDGDALRVEPDAGAKLVYNGAEIADGAVEGDLRLTDMKGGNCSLIVRVTDPHTGADTWNGYEIAVSASQRAISLSRHHHNWTLLQSVPVEIGADTWEHVKVEMRGARLQLFLNAGAEPVIDYTDRADALPAGRAGVRTWNSAAEFRRVTIQAAGAAPAHLAMLPAGSAQDVSGMWDAVSTGGARANYGWDTDRPGVDGHSQRIQLELNRGGTGTAGVANRGLNRRGIAVRRGATLAGSIYLRSNTPGADALVSLQSADGARTYAQRRLTGISENWARYSFSLTSGAADPHGRFALLLDRPETVWADAVTLMPTGKDVLGGVPARADIAAALKREGITFLRYGGSMVNAPSYRWKSMLGPPDRRPHSLGTWYPYSSNGFGIEEFVRFCRLTGIEPAVAINIDESPQDAADMVEYLNGPATSLWGARRAAAGHAEPYRLRYIEIGNEEAIDGNRDWYRRYLARFEALEPAIHAKDPEVQLVIAAWWRPNEPLCKQITQQLSGKAALWDVHVGGDGLHDGADVDREMTTMQRLFQEWAPGTSLKACIFEENGGLHNLQRALGHACILNATRRHGDFVLMDCPANCLQPWLQNDNGWDQGQLFFTPDQTWGMPPYYAQQMAAESYEPERVDSRTESPAGELDVTAARSRDGRTLVISVVNLGAAPHGADISIDGLAAGSLTGKVWTLSGELSDVNSPDQPERIKPIEANLPINGSHFEYEFMKYSYTVIRIRR